MRVLLKEQAQDIVRLLRTRSFVLLIEKDIAFHRARGEFTNEMYVGGMSSSLPEDVQYAMYRTVKGLENVKIIRNAYAIEYDCINPNQLKLSLEFRNIQGLFSGGQFNGSSGYEESSMPGTYCRNQCRKKVSWKRSSNLRPFTGIYRRIN